MILAYDEFVDLLAGGTTPQGVIDFQPSQRSKDRVAELIHRQKVSTLTPGEAAELSQFMQIEHLMRLAKARACAILQSTHRSLGRPLRPNWKPG